MRSIEMRWILASTAVVALACVGAAQPAWAGGDREEKGGQREEFHVVIDGLDGALLERAAAELKEHHPAVKVRIKEGVLKLHAEDGAAWKKAMHALAELGVPVGPAAGDAPDFGALKLMGDSKELRIVLDGKERKGARSDEEIAKKMGALEEKLVAAREAGREREVAELEQALEHLRQMRKELAGMREKHEKEGPDVAALRASLEEAKRALHEAMQSGEKGMPPFDLQEAEIREMKRYLEAMGREMGAEHKRAGPQGDLRQRMEHTRQALKHLKEARLPEQAQHVERALHRMEMAAQGEGRGPDRPQGFMIHGGPEELRFVEVQPAADGARPGPPRRAPAQVRHAPPPPRPEDCPPPSVGGFRRGPIHPRPQAQPPRPPPPPPPGADRRPIGQGRVVGPDGAPQPAVIVLEGQVHEGPQGPARFTVLRTGDPRPVAVRAAAAGQLGAAYAGPRPAMAPPGDLAGSVEQLRGEMAQLRAQLHQLMHQLADDDDDDDDDDEEDDDDRNEKRAPRR